MLNTLSSAMRGLVREYTLLGRTGPRTGRSFRTVRRRAARRTACRTDPAGAVPRTTRKRPAR